MIKSFTVNWIDVQDGLCVKKSKCSVWYGNLEALEFKKKSYAYKLFTLMGLFLNSSLRIILTCPESKIFKLAAFWVNAMKDPYLFEYSVSKWWSIVLLELKFDFKQKENISIVLLIN